MTDVICYGGKGGVGKTTCAAATALARAGDGQRVLVLSTDPAHSLGDSFDADLGSEPVEIAANCWASEVDPDAGVDRYRALVAALADELGDVGIDVPPEDLDALFAAGTVPGSDELAAVEAIVEAVESGAYDVVVVDTAPTGHFLRLLELPGVLDAATDAAVTVRKKIRGAADAAKGVLFGPAYYAFGRRRDEDDDAIEDLRVRMERATDVLRDPERTEFRVVLRPETMPIRETERLVARLRESDLPVRRLVVNGVLDDPDPDCARCTAHASAHAAAVATVRESFPDLTVWTLPELETEARGAETLRALADRIAEEERGSA